MKLTEKMMEMMEFIEKDQLKVKTVIIIMALYFIENITLMRRKIRHLKRESNGTFRDKNYNI